MGLRSLSGTGPALSSCGCGETQEATRGTSASGIPGALALRPYLEGDRSAVVRLLADLPTLYPGGDKWLQRRLDDVVAERATCTLALLGPQPVGISIETPKGRRHRKLSTIFVHPALRGRGIGARLLRVRIGAWTEAELDQVTVTVRARNAQRIASVLIRHGFLPHAYLQDRYGAAEDEIVLSWCNQGVLFGSQELTKSIVPEKLLSNSTARLSFFDVHR